MPLPLNSGFLAPSLPRAEFAAVVVSEAAQALKWVVRKKRFIRNPAHLGLCCVCLGILRQRLFCCHCLFFPFAVPSCPSSVSVREKVKQRLTEAVTGLLIGKWTLDFQSVWGPLPRDCSLPGTHRAPECPSGRPELGLQVQLLGLRQRVGMDKGRRGKEECLRERENSTAKR